MDQQNLIALPRIDKETDGATGDLFRKTLNSSSTISRSIVILPNPSTLKPPATSATKPWLPLSTCSVFYTLDKGLCGFSNLCHGGIQATLIDDCAGALGVLNSRIQAGLIPADPPGRWSPKINPGMVDLTKCMLATKEMTVQYLRPLRVPANVQVIVTIGEISDNGSYFVSTSIKGKDGKEYTRARAEWMVLGLKSKL
ncbi:uncharacterized protein FMAN_09753 [Fusarium mangiferae]|uniref:Thioesterase domain-containing protein n=1 Tax=Fusarium mangiferae TaxID=192010 RepID=A0A1L7UBQ4_FUSMA|nr:uncharacterized protein FMAN_09753 [Fusarium mangiferae]CVL07859.1 uncharacterized protein FMAN_09753 [Fusarium mangiferae]